MTQAPTGEHPWQQLFWLLVLAIPIASIARTVTSEEIFREPREWCRNRSQNCRKLIERKFFYVFTCEYCFSHYITILVLLITRYHLLLDDWRGYIIAFFSLVFVCNAYLNLYSRLRVDIAQVKTETRKIEKEVENTSSGDNRA